MVLIMKRREFLIILGVIILAVFCRLAFIFQLKNNPIFSILPGSDSSNYILWAKTMLQQGIFHKAVFYGMPLYAYFLAFIFKFFFMNLWVVRIIQLLMGVVNCLLIYLIAKKLFNATVGILTAILMSCYPMLIFYEILIMPTTLIIFLNSLLILSFFELKDKFNRKNLFLFGLILGIVSLAEPGIILFAAAIIVWLFFYFKDKPKRLLALYSLILISGMILALGLNTLKNYFVTKDLILVSAHGGINFYIGNNPSASGLADIPSYLGPSQKSHLEDSRLVAEEILKKQLKPSQVSNFWLQKSFAFIKRYPRLYLGLLFKKLCLLP